MPKNIKTIAYEVAWGFVRECSSIPWNKEAVETKALSDLIERAIEEAREVPLEMADVDVAKSVNNAVGRAHLLREGDPTEIAAASIAAHRRSYGMMVRETIAKMFWNDQCTSDDPAYSSYTSQRKTAALIRAMPLPENNKKET